METYAAAGPSFGPPAKDAGEMGYAHSVYVADIG
jgi:hypothetical protein